MIEEFITSALIIDDDETEIKDLLAYLEEKDIWVKHYTPEQLSERSTSFNNRKLIFLDLYLDNSKKSIENIALIRKFFKTIIGKNFGTYGIVLWTKHSNHYDDFCEKIFQKNNPFTLPLFVVALEKNKYKAKGNYEGILEELEAKLTSDISSSFFIEWNKSVKRGSDTTIATLYDLFTSHKLKEANLEYILCSLACNHTGINAKNAISYDLQRDLVKSLMDPLQIEISNNYKGTKNLFNDITKLNYSGSKEDKTIVFSKLNTLLLLDSHNLSQSVVIPGNLYQVLDDHSSIYINEFIDKKDNEISLTVHEDFKSISIKRICIELTPPCDFAQNKKQSYSRIVGGIQMDYDPSLKEKYFKGENFYTYLYPVSIQGYEKPQIFIFDFYRFQTVKENELKDSSKYKIILKTKDKLFADMLQKFSSHSARLGIAILYP